MKKNIAFLFPLFIVLYEIMTYLSNDAYLPALPQLASELNVSHHYAQWTLTAWFLGSASLQLFVGPISEKFGRRLVLIIGGIIFSLASLLSAFTYNIHWLLFSRFMQGAMISSVTVAGYAAIHEYFDHKKAISILAWMNSITVLAPALGPLLGSIIICFSSWRLIFILLGLGAAFTLVGLFKFMPETCPAEARKPIHVKKITAQYKQILCCRPFISSLLASCVLFGGFIAWLATGPFLIVDTFHYPVILFGILQAIVFGAFILGTRSVKHLLSKFDTAKIPQMGIAIAVVGTLLGLIVVAVFPHRLFGLLLGMIIFSFGSGLVFPVLSRLTVESHDAPMGSRMAIVSNLTTLTGALSTIIVSFVFHGSVLSLASLLLIFSLLAGVFFTVYSKNSKKPTVA